MLKYKRRKGRNKRKKETRIGLEDFNKLNVYWKNSKIIDYDEHRKTSLHYRILSATIPIEKKFNKEERENEEDPSRIIRRSNIKEKKKSKKKINVQNRYLTNYSYKERQNFELKSLGLEKVSPIILVFRYII